MHKEVSAARKEQREQKEETINRQRCELESRQLQQYLYRQTYARERRKQYAVRSKKRASVDDICHVSSSTKQIDIVEVSIAISRRFATPRAVIVIHAEQPIRAEFSSGLLSCLQYIDVSTATIKKRLVQRLVIIEVDEGGKLLEGHVSVAVGIHFFHQQPYVIIVHLKQCERTS